MHTVSDLIALSERLAEAPQLLPKHARTPPEILAITLAGQELGYAPMESLRVLQLVSGKVTLTADAMLGRIVKAGIHVRWMRDGSDGEAVLHLRRGEMEHTQRWSEEDRKRAGLNTDTWRKYGPAMLRARCVSAAVRAFCADVLGGAYLPGELPDDRKEEGVGELDALPERATKLPAAGEKALSLAAAQGFVAPHPIAEDPFVAVDLQTLDSRVALVEWLREAIKRAGTDKAAKGVVWEAFCARCADLEHCHASGEILVPKALLAEAQA